MNNFVYCLYANCNPVQRSVSVARTTTVGRDLTGRANCREQQLFSPIKSQVRSAGTEEEGEAARRSRLHTQASSEAAASTTTTIARCVPVTSRRPDAIGRVGWCGVPPITPRAPSLVLGGRRALRHECHEGGEVRWRVPDRYACVVQFA